MQVEKLSQRNLPVLGGNDQVAQLLDEQVHTISLEHTSDQWVTFTQLTFDVVQGSAHAAQPDSVFVADSVEHMSLNQVDEGQEDRPCLGWTN